MGPKLSPAMFACLALPVACAIKVRPASCDCTAPTSEARRAAKSSSASISRRTYAVTAACFTGSSGLASSSARAFPCSLCLPSLALTKRPTFSLPLPKSSAQPPEQNQYRNY